MLCIKIINFDYVTGEHITEHNQSWSQTDYLF